MKITVFNDTQVDWGIHAGSARGINSESRIPRCSSVIFEGPDHSELFVKVWNGMVMVRFDEIVKLSSTPFARARSALFKAAWSRKN